MTTLNEIIKKVGDVFNDELNGKKPRPEKDKIKVFGLAYKKLSDSGFVPAVPKETLTDEIILLPGDNYAGFLFFEYQDPITFTPVKAADQVRYSRAKYNVTLELIAFVNFQRFMGMTKWQGDYRIYREAFKNVISGILNTKLHTVGGTITPSKIYDQSIEEDFKGYAQDQQNKYLYQQPFDAMRY